MTITVDDALAQADALKAAAEASPVRQFRYELRRRAKEWSRAANNAKTVEGEGVIELAGSLSNGMGVLYEHELGNWAPLIRTLQNGGQFSLHLEDPMGQQRAGVYQNLFGPASPVVVKA